MRWWARVVAWAPAAAAAAATGWVGNWESAVAAGTAAFAVGQMAMALANRAVVARFSAEVSVAGLSEPEQALARRVGLDPVTVMEAKAAVKAAVRATLVRRGAGIAALCAAPQASAIAARARALEAQALASEESSASGTATESAKSAGPEAESPSAVVLGLAELSAAAAEPAAAAGRKDRRDDVE